MAVSYMCDNQKVFEKCRFASKRRFMKLVKMAVSRLASITERIMYDEINR